MAQFMTTAHLSPSRWPLVRRLGATGRPVRLALQFAAGAACLVGSFAWATAHLSDLAEPAQMTSGPAPITAGPSPMVPVARLDDWPEIKNGVPDLKRTEPVVPSAPASRPPAPVASVEAPAKRVDAPVPTGELPTGGQQTGRTEPGSPASAPVVEGAVQSPNADRHAGVTDSASRPSPRVSAPAEQAETRDAPAVSAPMALPKTALAGGETPARREGAVGPRRDREGQQAPGSIQAGPSASQRDPGKATKKAETKPAARSERKRVASAEPPPAVEEAAAAVAPAEAEARPPAESEPVRVLGMALPTGRKIKECLLELRC
jgi:hypothetical protein